MKHLKPTFKSFEKNIEYKQKMLKIKHVVARVYDCTYMHDGIGYEIPSEHEIISKLCIHYVALEGHIFDIYTSRPGMIIGKYGVKYKELKDELSKEFGLVISINLQEYSPF